MRDENNTPYEAEDATEVSLTPMASLEIEINQLLRDTKTNIPTKVGILVNKVTKAQYETRAEIGAEISALTNMVRDRDTRIAELVEENNSHIFENGRISAENKTTIDGLAGEVERLKNELSDLSEAHARLVDDNGKLWKDNAELHGINVGLKEARYRLASVIEDLAAVVRNS